MEYKLFGRSGLRVSDICLGTMTFGQEWGWGSSKEECRKIFDAYVDKGGNFIDTANHYTNGTSEAYLGEFIADKRDRIILATKFSLTMDPSDPNASGNHRKNMMQALNKSLKRLKTDYVDIYWLHAWDFLTPVDEVMRGLDDLVRSGKVLYIGISDAPAWVVAQANTLADAHGSTPFTSMQLEYSLVERTIEREHIPMAKALDLAIMAWSPLAMGALTGKYAESKPNSDARLTKNANLQESYLSERNTPIIETVVKIAREINRTPAQVALNWIIQQPGVIIPIIGAKNLNQLNDNLLSAEFRLDPKHLQELDEVSKIDLGFPHAFLQKPDIKQRLFGNTAELIHNHRQPIEHLVHAHH
jgi:aryl-alcohol dehydrogenase-like predicted oxidoreductase